MIKTIINIDRYRFKTMLIFFSYIPTRLWGFSGHVQTILHSVIGRVRCPWPIGERVFLTLHDGTTLTYDRYQPLDTNFPGNLAWQNYLLIYYYVPQLYGGISLQFWMIRG